MTTLREHHPEAAGSEAPVTSAPQPAAVEQAASAAQIDRMVGSVASEGVAGVGSTLPHAAAIQRAFGKHDISGVMAHVGGGAAQASACIGAKAYAFGGKVAFAGTPDLHTAAHEAAHVIQQRNGAVAASGLGAADDDHERNADRVADKVVAGESAEALLDATATGGHGANSGVVQRKLADDVKTKALGAVNLPLDAALPGRVTPRIPPDLFSGTRSIQLETEFGAGPVVQRAIDAASTNAPSATHGTVESQIVGRVRDQSRDLMTSSAFTWHAGPHGATAIAAPAVDEFLDPLVYTSDAKTRTLTAQVTHARRSDAEPFTVHIDPSPKIVAKVTSGMITGTQQIQTANDGALLASWTKHLKPKPGATVLGDARETQAFSELLATGGVAALSRWFDVMLISLLEGKQSARDWLLATYKEGVLQREVMKSLQHLASLGVPSARAQLDELVDAMRTLIEDPKTSTTQRTIMEDRLLQGGVARNVKIDASEAVDVNTDPQKHQDTDDPDFDRMRVAGGILARRELAPLIKACIDPVAFIKAHRVDYADALGHDVASWVIREAKQVGTVVDRFMREGLDAASLNPGDTSHAKMPADSSDIARNAARLGAVEALQEVADGMPHGSRSITGHLGLHRGLLHVKENFNGAKTTGGAMVAVADKTLQKLTAVHIERDVYFISRVSEQLDSHSDPERHDRALAIGKLAERLDSDSTKVELASLRKTTSQDKEQVIKDTTVKAVQSVAYTQALSAKTESNLAFRSAHGRYQAACREEVDGLIDEKQGGAKWVNGTLFGGNALKEGVDIVIAKLGANAGKLAIANPILGVALVAVDAFVSFRDWRVKEKLEQARTEIKSELDKSLSASERATLAEIQSSTQAAVNVAAAGNAYDANDTKTMASTLAAGKPAASPSVVALANLPQEQLDAFHTSMLSDAGLVQSELHQVHLGALAYSGDAMMTKFRAKIAAMNGVWKKG